MGRLALALAIGFPLALRGLVAVGSCSGDLCILAAVFAGMLLLLAWVAGPILAVNALFQSHERPWAVVAVLVDLVVLSVLLYSCKNFNISL